MLRGSADGKIGLVREASRRQTVKKQTSINLVHNSPMIPINVTFGRRLITGALALALVAVGCTSVSPVPTAPPNNVPTNPAVTGRPTQPLGTPNATTGSTRYGCADSDASRRHRDGHTVRPCACTSDRRRPRHRWIRQSPLRSMQVTSQVPPIRMLQPTKTVPYQIISRDDFQNYLLSTADEDTTPEWRTAEQNFFKRLGLLPQDADLNALLLQLYTSEVAAYYNPDDGTFYIIDRNAPFGPIDEVTTAHEYTHALQDQHFDLEGNRIKDPAEGDQSLAQLSVIEGDATLTSQNWMKDNMSQADQLQLLQDALGQLGNDQLATMPLILRRQLEFPYTEGLLFTTDVWGLGGYDAVNQAIQTPPASTEQILHSDKYYNHEAPVAVTADRPDLGVGFRVHQRLPADDGRAEHPGSGHGRRKAADRHARASRAMAARRSRSRLGRRQAEHVRQRFERSVADRLADGLGHAG